VKLGWWEWQSRSWARGPHLDPLPLVSLAETLTEKAGG
jgi:hypothetical protein